MEFRGKIKMICYRNKLRRDRFTKGILSLSATVLSLSACDALDSLNQKTIATAPSSSSSTSLQSSAPASSSSPSPSPSAKPSASPTPTASPTVTASPTPIPTPTTSAVPVSGTTPAWLQGKALNTWIEIPGTSGAGGAVVDAWGQLVLRDDTSEIFILASGGHGDSSDNRVVSVKLTDNAPQWILRSAPTPTDQLIQNSAYYADGKPSSRHNYQYNHWVPAVHRLMMFGLYGTWPSAWMYPTVDGFNPDTNTWDPAGTWPNMVAGAGYGVYVEKGTSAVWTNGLMRWDPSSKQFSSPITHSSGDFARFPWSEDTLRNQLFTLEYGDSQGYSTNLGVQASRIPLGGDTQYKVTFNPSAALTQFLADTPIYPAMDYDPSNDQFLFYDGHGAGAGRIYSISPNAGNTWDMTILPLGAGSPLPPAVPDAGINGRFLYVPSLKGFVMLPTGASNLWFIRTSN